MMATSYSSKQQLTKQDILRCRTCLAEEVTELISLHCRCDSRGKLVSEMLSELAPQTRLDQRSEIDMLPQHICDHCLAQLDAAFEFRQQAQDAIWPVENQQSSPSKEECCRICQRDFLDELISVFCVSGVENKLIADMIKDTCGVARPLANDGLPQNICGECFDALSTIYAFWIRIVKSDFSLRNTANELKLKSKLPMPQSRTKFVPQLEEDMDPFLYLDCLDIDADQLMKVFSTTEDAEYYEQLTFFGVICCCGKLLENDEEWQEHRREIHTIQELVPTARNKCDVCYYKFKYSSQLSEHQENREKKQFYRCKICNVLTKEWRNLQLHFEFTRFHPILDDTEEERIGFDAKAGTIYTPPGTCCDCYEEFETGESLLQHTLERHYPEREDHPAFQCMICYNSFADKQSLLKHQLTYKGTREYHCLESVCKFRTTNRFDMKKHLESGAHVNAGMLPAASPEPEITEYFCCFFMCTASFESYEALQEHCESDHIEQRLTNQIVLAGVTDYVCPLCIRHFPTDSAFRKHIQKQSERNHICGTCGKKFFARDTLIQHEKIHAGTQPKASYSCNQCGATYVGKYTLERHIKKIHEGVLPELCTTCGKRFGHKPALRNHIANVHLKERPYKCSVCFKQFGAKVSLQKHMLIHSEDRPFKCPLCENTYKNSSDLKRHDESVHQNVRPFVCELCDASFTRNRELRVHMTRHTRDRFFKCNEGGCNFSTNVSKRMEEHVNKHYQDSKDSY